MDGCRDKNQRSRHFFDEHPKLKRIGDYWIKEQTTKVVNFLKEYQNVFEMDYNELKGIVQDMGERKIKLLPDENFVKKRPYKYYHTSIKV